MPNKGGNMKNIGRASMLLLLGVTSMFQVSCNIGNKGIEKDVLAIVNDSNIYLSDYEKAKEQYPDFDEKTILEYMITELLAIQQSEELNIQITDTNVENNINVLKNMDMVIYEKAIEQYGNLEGYKTALKNTLTYAEVKKTILQDFFSSITLDVQSIKSDADIYMAESGCRDLKDEEVHEIEDALFVNYQKSLGHMFFEKYKHQLIKNANISFINNETNVYVDSFYKNNIDYDTIQEEFDKKSTDINYDDIEYFYKSYFAFNSPYIKQNYIIKSIKSIPFTDYRQKYISIIFEEIDNDDKIIEISFILDITVDTFSLPDGENISVNGITGVINELPNSSDLQQVGTVNLVLQDRNLSSIIKVNAYNCSAEEVLNFTKNIIRVSYNLN